MKQLIVLLCIMLCLVVAGVAIGENWTSHRIIIIVRDSNEFVVKKTNVPLNTGSVFSKLQWATDQFRKKITVSADLTSAKCGLEVRAVDCVGGISTGKIPLIESAQDFVISISNFAGRCGLKYSASGVAGENNGFKIHTVFYTIVDAY